MPDTFIDHDETQIYGAHALKMLDRYILSTEEVITAIITYLKGELRHSTEQVALRVDTARTASAQVRSGARSKEPLRLEAKRALGRFSRHLATHAPEQIDRRTFFPGDGTAQGVGHSAARILHAVTHVATKLAAADCPVREREYWQAEFARLGTELSQAVDHSDHAYASRIAATPEVQQSLAAWRNVYGACKLIVEGVLRLQGRLHLMPVIFHDLAVPAGTKLTSPPPEPTALLDPPIPDGAPEPEGADDPT